MMMPAGPGAGLVLVQSHVALLRLELRFNAPTEATHACQGLQRSVLRSVGQVVAGLAAVQVPAPDGSVDFAGLPPAGWPHPPGVEQIAAGTLASLRHSDLPLGLLRQFITALNHGAPLPASLGLRGAPGPGRPDWSTRAPETVP